VYWFQVTKCPAGEVITFNFQGTNYTLTAANITTPVTKIALVFPGWVTPVSEQAWIHFSSPGDYEICFYLECPAVPCLAGAQIVAQECLATKAYQWKDSGKIVLDEKWNLISLPLVPFDTSLATLLLSLDPELKDGDGTDDLLSIWYYQWNTAGTAAVWTSWPPLPFTMQDGRAYWARLTYPMAASYNWWVFGTAKNMPPMNPLAYEMAKGWNMFGFTSLDATMPSDDYLWNFGGGSPELPYPLIYGWDNTGTAATSDWLLIDPTVPDDFETGQGYWGYFPFGGTIVPP
jgi:hypothetical protein